MFARRIVGMFALASVLTFAVACGDDPAAPDDGNEQEVITDVTITLTPVGGGAAITATIADPDGEGPLPPTAQTGPINLTAGTTYDGSIGFFDRSDPNAVEDITAEVRAEADEHRVFYILSGFSGVAVPDASLDTDSSGAPVGVTFQVVVDATASGTGTIRVVLSHYDETPKGDGSTQSNETDADVSFSASVS